MLGNGIPVFCAARKPNTGSTRLFTLPADHVHICIENDGHTEKHQCDCGYKWR